MNNLGLSSYLGRPHRADRDSFARDVVGNSWIAISIRKLVSYAAVYTAGKSARQ
ncbi:hypothetical protein [Frankia sp. Cj5]|uniref:hypothetical protein n=1 Tax=Frankia sp. Cj5 TaxID=2880978 RepID=UPI001EF5ADFA|nr:hypothetical protein [Frankia sp. Cj5]